MLGLLEVGPLEPFFPLTSAFFGLTSSYKVPLLEEIYICTQHLKGFTYADVLSLPTYERRFFLGLLTKDAKLREEQMEQMKEQQAQTSGKGTRKTRVSGDALKTRMKNGDVPLK